MLLNNLFNSKKKFEQILKKNFSVICNLFFNWPLIFPQILIQQNALTVCYPKREAKCFKLFVFEIAWGVDE